MSRTCRSVAGVAAKVVAEEVGISERRVKEWFNRNVTPHPKAKALAIELVRRLQSGHVSR
jgi:DNA-binding transcriptional regulator YiaG